MMLDAWTTARPMKTSVPDELSPFTAVATRTYFLVRAAVLASRTRKSDTSDDTSDDASNFLGRGLL